MLIYLFVSLFSFYSLFFIRKKNFSEIVFWREVANIEMLSSKMSEHVSGKDKDILHHDPNLRVTSHMGSVPGNSLHPELPPYLFAS